jgi:drug/metabolite transporter (DMT)-like permease
MSVAGPVAAEETELVPADPPDVAPEPDPSVVPSGEPVVEARRRHIPIGIAYMVAGAFFFSLMSLLVKLASRLPSHEIVLVRALITLALSAAPLWWAGRDMFGHRRALLAARGAVGFVGLYSFYWVIARLSLADATVLQYTNPIFAAVRAVPLLGERLRAAELIAMAVSLLGVVLVARPSFLFGGTGLDPVPVVVGLLGAVGSAAAYVLVRRLRATEDPAVVVFWFALVSVVLSAPAAFLRLVTPTALEWVVLLGVGITTQLGQIFLTRGLHHERAGRATAIGYVQVVFAMAWGALFFGELPSATTLAGAALVVGSAVTIALRRQRP